MVGLDRPKLESPRVFVESACRIVQKKALVYVVCLRHAHEASGPSMLSGSQDDHGRKDGWMDG